MNIKKSANGLFSCVRAKSRQDSSWANSQSNLLAATLPVLTALLPNLPVIAAMLAFVLMAALALKLATLVFLTRL